jgi:hypothetical protein
MYFDANSRHFHYVEFNSDYTQQKIAKTPSLEASSKGFAYYIRNL